MVGHFQRLIVVDGQAITVQDLEDAADVATTILQEGTQKTGGQQSKAEPTRPGRPQMHVSRRRGESYHAYLCRVHIEWVRQQHAASGNSALQEVQAAIAKQHTAWKPPSDGSDGSEDDPPESLSQLLHSKGESKCETSCCQAPRSQDGASEGEEQELWRQLWLAQRPPDPSRPPEKPRSSLRRRTRGAADCGGSAGGAASGRGRAAREDASEVRPLSASKMLSVQEGPGSRSVKRPKSASASFLQRLVPMDSTIGRVNALERVTPLGPELSPALAGGALGGDLAGGGTNADALVRLARQRRLRGSETPNAGDAFLGQAQSRAQWLQQLAVDYPDDFGRRARAAERKDALIQSYLWIFSSHGDPHNEDDWHRRLAWLSGNGQLWLEPREDEPKAPPSLFLGGLCVKDLLVLHAGKGVEVVSSLGGRPVYAFRIELPSMRHARRKYLAAESSELCDQWISTCLTL